MGRSEVRYIFQQRTNKKDAKCDRCGELFLEGDQVVRKEVNGVNKPRHAECFVDAHDRKL